VWGTGLFSDDEACDIRAHYRELLEDGVEDSAAMRLTLDNYAHYLAESDGIALIAFAVTQSNVGRLDADVRDRALAIIDAGADLAAWEEENPKLLPKRRAVLEKARAQLTGPQPARKRLRPPKRKISGLAGGDVLAFEMPGRVSLLRVVRVRPHRLGESPILEELDFDGPEVPARDALERLGPKVKDPIVPMHPLSSDTRIFAFVMQGIDWEGAGFRKVQTIAPRAGDEEAALPDSGSSWASLAGRYRNR
jgi:hypothetical protein